MGHDGNQAAHIQLPQQQQQEEEEQAEAWYTEATACNDDAVSMCCYLFTCQIIFQTRRPFKCSSALSIDIRGHATTDHTSTCYSFYLASYWLGKQEPHIQYYHNQF